MEAATCCSAWPGSTTSTGPPAGLRTSRGATVWAPSCADALADTLTAALRAMPPFWRTTYPQGRSGSECMAALFSTDRGCAGLGVEFWHLFSWAQAALECSAESGGDWSDPEASERADMAAGHPLDGLQRARRLFLWDSGVWRGQGREALLLSQQQKRELALLLEASGEGIPGTAERQFLDPDPELQPPQPPELPKAHAPSAAQPEAGTAGNGKPEPHHGPPRDVRRRADRTGLSPSPVQPSHSRQSRRRRLAHFQPAPHHQRAGP